MPKRATLSYSSEDAPKDTGPSHELYVYYCKYSGRHAFTTDCQLSSAPRRRTDAAAVIDTEKHQLKLYTVEAGPKLLKRASGAIEKQYRQNLGKLPIAYRPEPDSRFVYILDNAVETFSMDRSKAGGDKPPVPPCIVREDGSTCRIALEVDDHADHASILKISADFVRVELKGAVTSTDANEQLLELMRAVLGCRLAQLTLVRGESTRHKRLLVQDLTPQQVFEKLQRAIVGGAGPAK